MRRVFGKFIAAPRKETVRLRAMANATAATEMAPAMTKASEGSQAPARSRNPKTLAGSAIPETMRPSPKITPATHEAKMVMKNPQFSR